MRRKTHAPFPGVRYHAQERERIDRRETEMRDSGMGCGMLVILAIVGVVAWMLGLEDVVRASVAEGHLLDWLMGGFCLLWLLVLLKVPWDLYFQAQAVAFELQRAQERKIPVPAEREAYIHTLRRRLGWLAVGGHLFSAAVIALVTAFSHGQVGYYFAAFYLISTIFRPAVAGYVYLWQKLRAIAEEAHYPREDIQTVLERLERQESEARDLTDQVRECREALVQEAMTRDTEAAQLRQNVHALSREFETTISRLSDNQEVIKGVQAFVRLIAQSASSTP
jgi:hypothetical protein